LGIHAVFKLTRIWSFLAVGIGPRSSGSRLLVSPFCASLALNINTKRYHAVATAQLTTFDNLPDNLLLPHNLLLLLLLLLFRQLPCPLTTKQQQIGFWTCFTR
jgi:hypothetical protein